MAEGAAARPKACPKCGCQLTEPDSYCGACGASLAAADRDAADETRQTTVGFLVIVAGMLLGGMLAGWLSPSRTVLEPGVGIAAAVTGANLATGMTQGMTLGWVMPFLIGAAGAWIGERLPKRSTTRR